MYIYELWDENGYVWTFDSVAELKMFAEEAGYKKGQYTIKKVLEK